MFRRLDMLFEMLLESNFDAWHAGLDNVPLCPHETEGDTLNWTVWS
jgi:hypothetical protein